MKTNNLDQKRKKKKKHTKIQFFFLKKCKIYIDSINKNKLIKYYSARKVKFMIITIGNVIFDLNKRNERNIKKTKQIFSHLFGLKSDAICHTLQQQMQPLQFDS